MQVELLARIAEIHCQTFSATPTLGAAIYKSSCLNYNKMETFGSNMIIRKKKRRNKNGHEPGKMSAGGCKREKRPQIYLLHQ